MDNIILREDFMNGLNRRNKSGIPFGRTDSGPSRGPVPGSGTPTKYPNPLPPAYTGGGPPWSPPAYPPKSKITIPPPGTNPPSFPGKAGPPKPGVPPTSNQTQIKNHNIPVIDNKLVDKTSDSKINSRDQSNLSSRNHHHPNKVLPNNHSRPRFGPAPREHSGRNNNINRIRPWNRTVWPYIPFGYQGWFGPYDYYNYPPTIYNQTYNYYGYPENIDINLDEEYHDENQKDFSDNEKQLLVTNPNFVQQLR